MKVRKVKKTILPFVAIVIYGCSDLGVVPILPPPTGELAWVGRPFIGGEQCTEKAYTPPDTRQLLNANGIAVAETDVEHYPVCASCSCPTYAAMHYALISVNQVKGAQSIAFELRKPPGR